MNPKSKHKFFKFNFSFIGRIFPKPSFNLLKSSHTTFSEIIFDILLVACLREIVKEINLDFQNFTSTDFWIFGTYILFFLNIWGIWFFYMYYTQWFEKNDLSSRIIFGILFLTTSFFVFTIYFCAVGNSTAAHSRSAGGLVLIGEFAVFLNIFWIFWFCLRKNHSFKESLKVFFKEAFIIWGIILLCIFINLMLLIFLGYQTSWIILLINELIISIGIFLIIFIWSKKKNNPKFDLPFTNVHLKTRFLMLVNICLAETLISILGVFSYNVFKDQNISSIGTLEIMLSLITSFIIIYLLWCLYVDRISIVKFRYEKELSKTFIFSNLLVILSLIFISKGLENVIKNTIYYETNQSFSEVVGVSFWGVSTFLISITFISNRHHCEYTMNGKKFVQKNNYSLKIDTLLFALLTICIGSSMVLIMNPFWSIIILFFIVLVVNIVSLRNIFKGLKKDKKSNLNSIIKNK